MKLNLQNIPKEFVKQAKEYGLELVKPASKEGIRKIAIGSIAGGAISPIYSRGFDYAWGLLPVQNEIVKKIVKILIPAGISALALKTKLLGGNILAGVPVGVSISEVVKAILGIFTGKISGLAWKKAATPSAETTTTLEGVDGVWGVF